MNEISYFTAGVICGLLLSLIVFKKLRLDLDNAWAEFYKKVNERKK